MKKLVKRTVLLVFLSSLFCFFGFEKVFSNKQQESLLQIPLQQNNIVEKDYVEGEVIVKYKDNAKKSPFSLNSAQLNESKPENTDIKEQFPSFGMVVFQSQTKSTKELIKEIEKNADVEYVEPNYKRYPTWTPDDTIFHVQWPHQDANDHDIDSTNMWDIEDENAQEVVIAVVDSGLHYAHTELSLNTWHDVDCVDDEGNAIGGGGCHYGWDYADNDNDPDDTAHAGDAQGHGTFVSSIIGAQMNNSEGVAGMSRYNNLKIMALRFNFDVLSELKSINFAKNNGAKVINASFGGESFSQSERDALETFPGIVVAASGNGGSDNIGDDNDIVSNYPCNYTLDNLICVGASDDADDLTDFSNYGQNNVDLVAPGEAVAGVGYDGSDWVYASGNGTSFASPYVAGAAALLYSHNPTISQAQVRSLIFNNVDNVALLNIATGGRLNINNSLNDLLSAPTRSNGQPTGALPVNTTSTDITLDTDENATCKYSTIPNTEYDAMVGLFTTTGLQAHSANITGLVNNGSYTYYAKCNDNYNNKNETDYIISFSVDGWWQPKASQNLTWQWQLDTGDIDTTYDVDVYDVDLFDTPQSKIDQLHTDGRKVICYFSAGSWEDWRSDAGDFTELVKGNNLDGWEGEKWLDIRDTTLQPIMQSRLDLAVTKNCDGVEPDNIDGYTNDTGFPLTPADQITYNNWLATEAHNRNLSIGLKNDIDQIGDLVGSFDWALNEQCYQYDECDEYQTFISADKPVFGVEYELEPEAFCAQANVSGYSWLKKNINLDAWRYGCEDYEMIRADVDQNGTINTTDAQLTLRNSLGLDMSSTNWQISVTTGDVDCNGNTNSTDAMLTLRYSIGLNMTATNWCE